MFTGLMRALMKDMVMYLNLANKKIKKGLPLPIVGDGIKKRFYHVL